MSKCALELTCLFFFFLLDTIKHLGQGQDRDVSCILTMLDTVTDKSAYNYIDFNAFV